MFEGHVNVQGRRGNAIKVFGATSSDGILVSFIWNDFNVVVEIPHVQGPKRIKHSKARQGLPLPKSHEIFPPSFLKNSYK